MSNSISGTAVMVRGKFLVTEWQDADAALRRAQFRLEELLRAQELLWEALPEAHSELWRAEQRIILLRLRQRRARAVASRNINTANLSAPCEPKPDAYYDLPDEFTAAPPQGDSI
jgi:hypothetical protein